MSPRPSDSIRALLLASRFLFLACLMAHGGSAFAAIFTVGTGAGCTHGTIQSALNAANAAFGADTVRLTRSLTYQPEANTINATNDLYIVGGFATCSQATTDSIRTVVSGTGGAAAPVFRITAATGVLVMLRDLIISGGDWTSGSGGGILFEGDGVLQIDQSLVQNNTAGTGGGIRAIGTGTNAELIIGEGTYINNNIALKSGGGISISGPIEMSMVAPNSLIAFNDALGDFIGTGYGGGLQVSDRAIAYIGSSGVGNLGAIYANSALDGGGISIVSGQSDGADALVHLFTTDPSMPVMLRQNYAADTGGGVYLQSWKGSFPDYPASIGRLCAWDFRFDENEARDGSAIYQNSYVVTFMSEEPSIVRLNDPTCIRPTAVRCTSGVACNTIARNNAVNTDGEPSDGATLRVLPNSDLYAYRFDMRGNRGGDAIRADGTGTEIWIEDCLLSENQLTRQLIRSEGSDFAITSIVGCTIARNVVASTDVIHSEGQLILRNSIINQTGNLTLAYSGAGGADLEVEYVLASDTTTLPSSLTIRAGNPLFIDAANGNYRLQLYSLGVDFAPVVPGVDRDLDYQLRDQDLPSVPNLYGIRDLGAYERQSSAGDCNAADTIFCNGFDP